MHQKRICIFFPLAILWLGGIFSRSTLEVCLMTQLNPHNIVSRMVFTTIGERIRRQAV